MRPLRRRSTVHLAARALVAGLVALALAAVPVAAGAATPTPTAALPTATSSGEISFVGHGWGHGRGMSQFGALGYAVDHGWSATQILTHFYGGTRVATDAGNPTISVELTRLTGVDTIVQGPGLTVNGTSLGSGYGYALVRSTGSGSLQLYTGTSCAGPWTTSGGTLASGVVLATAGAGEGSDTLLRTCESGISYGYRGVLKVVLANSTVYTHNVLPIESYLRGVLPKEVSGSWGPLGNGRGRQALQAQAVAARSYALASSPRSSGASVCDTTACQVYSGAFSSKADGASATLTRIEQAETDLAVSVTAGTVMRFTSTGAIARTEFSSSSGGWTAGGTFPAVVDDGDDYSGNPNHDWSATFTEAQVAARLGISGVRSVSVTGRNGLGDLGGRVTSVTVVDGSGASHTYTGAAFRTAMGTSTFKSDWFAVSSVARAEAEAIVTALYQDLLGRNPEAAGLADWSTQLMAGTSQTALVASLTSSMEYIRLRITQAYRDVLGRAPEAAGMSYWVGEILAGRATVDDVQRRFYDSQEFFNRSGGTATGYVDLLYRTMFERSASAKEAAYWSGRIGVVGRSQVVDGIWFSMEAALYRAGGYYRVFLQREAEWTGRQYWATILLRDGEGAVRIGIAGSVEYAQLAVKRAG
ncbi:DUF4214 domain-containing protein [Actinotalea sp.]|uniref:DUF4214 domain-containing protein n=1 Tax=Actinotalea sp. TaxID=1872145 RepID=UPI003563A175